MERYAVETLLFYVVLLRVVESVSTSQPWQPTAKRFCSRFIMCSCMALHFLSVFAPLRDALRGLGSREGAKAQKKRMRP